jgi:hypothetical protein
VPWLVIGPVLFKSVYIFLEFVLFLDFAYLIFPGGYLFLIRIYSSRQVATVESKPSPSSVCSCVHYV